MIEVFYIGYRLFKGLSDKIHYSIADNKNKNKYKNNRFNTYTDPSGDMRFIDDGKIAFYERDPRTGDMILFRGANKYRNISEEDRLEKLAEYSKNGRATVIKWENRGAVRPSSKTLDMPLGLYYKDVNSLRMLVIRRIEGYYYYMDAETGVLLRPTDGETKLREERVKNGIIPPDPPKSKSVDEVMMEYNEKHKTMKKYGVDDFFWDKFYVDDDLSESNIEYLGKFDWRKYE